jgi:selenocysteine lyase/cysteine desulfurase
LIPSLRLVGDDLPVPCVDGVKRPYVGLDAGASTGALPAVAARVSEFLPWYSSVHRGAGYKSQVSTAAYEDARQQALAFAGRGSSSDDVAIICRNTTEAINHLAYRLRSFADVVVTTVVEHHANLLPWARQAKLRFVECATDGTFSVDDVAAALDARPRPALLAVTGASNVTGWMPPIDDIIDAAHERNIAVVVDAAQLAPHRPLPRAADFVAWSGHKMYAPFGAGVLIGPRASFMEGDPFLAGGGAVELVDLDEVVWSEPPEREEAGSPNVLGAVALAAAMDQLTSIGWPAIIEHEESLRTRLRTGLEAIEGVRVLGPGLDVPGLPVASFIVEGISHALVAARLSAEHAIGVRHGCFCAHPYLVRLLGLSPSELARFRDDARQHRRHSLPGAVRASACISTTIEDIDRLLDAVAVIASGGPTPADYVQDPLTGDWWPEGFPQPYHDDRRTGGGCARS